MKFDSILFLRKVIALDNYSEATIGVFGTTYLDDFLCSLIVLFTSNVKCEHWVLGNHFGPAVPPPLIQNSSLLHQGGPTAPPPPVQVL